MSMVQFLKSHPVGGAPFTHCFVDESFSTLEVYDEGGLYDDNCKVVRKKKHHQEDSLAAAIILQRFFDEGLDELGEPRTPEMETRTKRTIEMFADVYKREKEDKGVEEGEGVKQDDGVEEDEDVDIK